MRRLDGDGTGFARDFVLRFTRAGAGLGTRSAVGARAARIGPGLIHARADLIAKAAVIAGPALIRARPRRPAT